MTNKRSSAPGAAKTCEQLALDLSAYFDGELDGPARSGLELHLQGCTACGQKLEALKKLRSAMTSLSSPMTRRGSVLDMLKAELRGEGGANDPDKRRTS